MTKKEIWLEIAEAYATGGEHRSIRQVSITSDGICGSLEFDYDGEIFEQIVAMPKDVKWDVALLFNTTLDKSNFWYAFDGYDCHEDDDELRALYCCLMAAMED